MLDIDALEAATLATRNIGIGQAPFRCSEALALIAELRASRKVADKAFELLNEIDTGHGCDRMVTMPLRAAISELSLVNVKETTK